MGSVAKNRLIAILKTLSDKTQQKEQWPEGKGEAWSSYQEATEAFYELYEMFCEHNVAGISEKNKAALEELYQSVDNFDDAISEEELADVELMLKNSKWMQIQEKSALLLSAIEEEEKKNCPY